MSALIPFQNDADVLELEDFTIESQSDCLSLYGSLDIRKDLLGLTQARLLRDVLVAAVTELEHLDNLPSTLPNLPTDSVDNPFL